MREYKREPGSRNYCSWTAESMAAALKMIEEGSSYKKRQKNTTYLSVPFTTSVKIYTRRKLEGKPPYLKKRRSQSSNTSLL